jgi:DNA-binding response OmpR family regulator
MAGLTMEVLFVPRKAETLSLVRQAAGTMDVNLHICTDPEEVHRLLFCHRYDGLIVDHGETTENILRALRQSPSSRNAIAIDVHDQEIALQSVFELGANLAMVYPLTVEHARKTLQLAMGLMMLGRRSYYRHPVEIPARITVDGHQFEVLVNNVSEQGIGMRTELNALKAGPLQCSFELPDGSRQIAMEATVIWADKTGQAGCRIEQVTHGREQFAEYINSLFYQVTTGYSAVVAIARHDEISAVTTA